QVVEAENVEDVLDGLVEAGQPQVAAVAADLLDGTHHGPEARARDVAETRAVDHDLELLQRDSLLQCPLEEAHRVGVDELLGIEEDDVSDVAALDRQLAHPMGRLYRIRDSGRPERGTAACDVLPDLGDEGLGAGEGL